MKKDHTGYSIIILFVILNRIDLSDINTHTYSCIRGGKVCMSTVENRIPTEVECITKIIIRQTDVAIFMFYVKRLFI